MYVRRVDRTELARRIYDAAHLTGTFTLRSGVVSHEYFDKYRFESDPRLLRDIATSCAALVPDGVDALAGLELGGVPLATMISQAIRLPAVYVRKQAKTYGTCRLAEGAEIDDRSRLALKPGVAQPASVSAPATHPTPTTVRNHRTRARSYEVAFGSPALAGAVFPRP